MAVEFLNNYFINPIYSGNPYNFVNTIVYAIIALVLLYVIYKGLEKLKVKINRKFFYALLPFIFLGSSLRAFVDHEIITYNFWTVSPGIWLTITGLFLLCFTISFGLEKYVNKKWAWWFTCFKIGIGLLAVLYIWFFNKLQFANAWALVAIIGIAIGISALLYFIFRSLKFKWCIAECGFFPVMAHMFDASATFVAVDFFGAVEKHPLTRIVGDWTGSAASLFILKLAILLPAIYLIQTEIKNRNFANYLLVAIAVLGLSEGLRDLLTLILI